MSANPCRFLTLVVAAGAAAMPLSAEAAESLAGPYRAQVERVVDGDTLQVRVPVWPGFEAEALVRLRGVDAPEVRAHCEAEREVAGRARDFLEATLRDGTVVLMDVSGDKYFGRVLAHVATDDGTPVADLLLREGLVRHYEGGKRGGWCAAR